MVVITLLHPVTINATCRKKPIHANNMKTSTEKPTESVSFSSSLPNLLTSDGQLKLFPYNPNETSAQSELIHIMGHSAMRQVNKTALPMFPKDAEKISQFARQSLKEGQHKMTRM